MARLLEESEIDDWFQERKTALEESMEQALQKGAQFEKEQKRFDTAFRKLLDEYNRKYHDAAAYKHRHEQLEKPIKAIRAAVKKRMLKTKLAWKLWLEDRKKAKQQREYEKLFHIRKFK